MAAEPVQLPTSGSLAGILDVLETDEDFRALISDEIEVPESDIDPSITVGVPEGLRPALAAGAAGTRPVVLVVASGREAEEMVEAIRSWYSGDPNDVAQLEAWETLPHERLSPRADTVASRMAVFRRLMHPQEGSKLFGPIRILVMPVRSLIQPVVAGLGDVEPLVFSQGEELALDEASHRLVENAYTRVDLVMDRGEFAVRGGIIDVFPPTLPHPVRIEFFGDEIDTIKEFHASDQRTYGSDIPMVWATPCRELQLTEKVRRKPYSVLLFDEIEKAHPDVLNILLQILDEGRVTDAHGRVVNFENTVIVMTSNAGSQISENLMGFGKTAAQAGKEKAMKALRDFLRPEFISRVDEIVYFQPLSQESYARIAVLMLNELIPTLGERGITLSWQDSVPAALAAKAVGGKRGARDLRNAIRREVENQIALLLVNRAEDPVTAVHLTADENGNIQVSAVDTVQ